MWDDVKGILGAVAPTIATALGGPLAGGAVALLAKAVGLDENAAPDQIKDALKKADPATLAELKRVDIDYKQSLINAGVRLEEINQQDRANARQRQIAMGDITPAILAVLVVGAFFSFIGFAAFAPWAVIDGRMEFIMLAVGWIGGIASSVILYYFGSSSGSAKKNVMFEKLTSR